MKSLEYGIENKIDVDNEIEIMKKLDHENIVKYFGHFKKDQTMNILIELCEVVRRNFKLFVKHFLFSFSFISNKVWRLDALYR